VLSGNGERDVRILRAVIVCLFLAFAAVVRVLPHPWNFTPMGAMALFSGQNWGGVIRRLCCRWRRSSLGMYSWDFTG
jgi:prepilin signal peptidase PulO-like enzyme (type II secretory pathway)